MNRRSILTTVGATLTATTGIEALRNNAANQQNETNTQDCATPTSTPDSSGGGNSGGDGKGTIINQGGPLRIREYSLVDSYGNAEVEGIVENVSENTLSYAQVTVYFYDSDDVRIGNTIWNMEAMDAGLKTQFKTVLSQTPMEQVARYEVQAGTEAL